MSAPTIPIARPVMGDREAEAAARVIRSGWVTQGPEVAAFEEEFATFVGAEHAVAVSSCTTALHLALLGVGVGAGDEVVTVSHSYIATANAVTYCGATPVFVDVERATFNMDPTLVEAAITDRTRAILCVHQIGMACDVEALHRIAERHGLPLVEDAACAAGSSLRIGDDWQQVGRPHSEVACFSFHPRKVMSTGDGGMLTTDDAELAARFRLLRQHGMSVNDRARHGSSTVVFEEHGVIGFNYRLTDIQAAVGRVQLEQLPEIVDQRRTAAHRYHAALSSVVGVTPPFEADDRRSNWQSYAVTLDDGLDQRTIMQGMLDRGIATRRGIMCAHRETPYRVEGFSLPASEHSQDQVVLLPLFPQLTEAEIDRVVTELAAVVGASR